MSVSMQLRSAARGVTLSAASKIMGNCLQLLHSIPAMALVPSAHLVVCICLSFHWYHVFA